MATVPIPRQIVEEHSRAMRTAKLLAKRAGRLSLGVPEWMLEQVCNDRTRPSKGTMPRKNLDDILGRNLSAVRNSVIGRPSVFEPQRAGDDFERLKLLGSVISMGAPTDKSQLEGCLDFLEAHQDVEPRWAADVSQSRRSRKLAISGSGRSDIQRRKLLTVSSELQRLELSRKRIQKMSIGHKKDDIVVLLDESIRL